MRARRTGVAVVGLTLIACGQSEGCRRNSAHYDRATLTAALEAEASDAGLFVGEFTLAPDAIVDGDTIKVSGLDTSLRLIGLDTEETFKSRKDRGLYESLGFDAYLAKKREDTDRPVKCATPLGEEAKAFAKEFFRGAVSVRLERDHPKELRGAFGRLLAYVYVRRGEEWVNYNIEAVRAGMSPYFAKYSFSRRFHDEFMAAQAEARAAGRGIWDPGKEHYRDYVFRLHWWNARARFIKRFDDDGQGRDDHIVLTHWDALDRIKDAEGDQIHLLATVGEIRPSEGARPTRVSLSRRMFSDFPLIFFDDRVFEATGIEEAKGEFVHVIGTVSSYTFRARRRSAKTREVLQIEIKRPDQVVVSDPGPWMLEHFEVPGQEPEQEQDPEQEQEPEQEQVPEQEQEQEQEQEPEPEQEPQPDPEGDPSVPPPPEPEEPS